ncbi:ATP-binding cassette domain-containing protein [Streptomyces sp. 3MP-14]|uniref:ATP-binding cassette domain-containing protein n=1 Tax=Streptomyces mimosae TaxID=2586635 RepID=A0A5N6ABF9_9ACTN|nr:MULTISPECIES: ATP-binding cassette domain-containing protein [Streptomyces]KAB8165169.1 ATP-binding cassette domain-containing protein [Streptomyces mimosae]KAB8175801.1 ATP-binding cassette domain-containing protein [Streptomyces sp. 3MP-14]
MTEATIEVRGLRKRYGPLAAVDDLSFTVRPGRVTGFVGPNGAGKSTTMRVIMGLDRPDAGQALVSGRPYAQLPVPLCEIGALLDPAACHPGRSATDHLRWLAHTAGLPERRIAEVLTAVGLTDVARRPTGGYSLGMRQRLGIAVALLGDPPVLIFDEPVNGLDPQGIRWMRGLLNSLAAEGRAVLVSSHLMRELEGVADHLVVLSRGRAIADTTVAELIESVARGRVELRTERREEALAALTALGATVAVTGDDSLTVAGLPAERVARALAERSVPHRELGPHRPSLEEAYMEISREAVEFEPADLPFPGEVAP